MHFYKDGVQDLNKKMTVSRWSPEDGVVHINILERLAIFFGIEQLFHISMQWKVCKQNNHIN